ncbi:hypothetical protein T10_1852 [Trichinella papuae]|uniref:Uncharacterized protein n=1 Tax=Trichinella papuae TaxID=268474 RepID=A0A0V1MRL8_9BILA|nr:hypothetical protein T10_1852 [Trichinella papuae]
MIMKGFLLISLIFNIRVNICNAVLTAEQSLYNFKMMVQDWFNESQTSSRYYVLQKVKGTVIYENYMSTDFEFKRSNCTKYQMPVHLVREKYGCFAIDSEDLKHIMKCTILHKGCMIALQTLNNFAAQCHRGDSSALHEIEKLFPDKY